MLSPIKLVEFLRHLNTSSLKALLLANLTKGGELSCGGIITFKQNGKFNAFGNGVGFRKVTSQ